MLKNVALGKCGCFNNIATEEKGRKVSMTSNIRHHCCLRSFNNDNNKFSTL